MEDYQDKAAYTQAGQTLVETMVASLVLVMGISAAVALAVYGLGATSSISKQLIGIGLAREGMEAVKNMRDTNWLQTALSPNCYDFFTDDAVANCYENWLAGAQSEGAIYGYNINPGSTERTFLLKFDTDNPDNQNFWDLEIVPEFVRPPFGLDYALDGASDPPDHSNGFYVAGKPVAQASSDFARAITLSADNSFDPFNHSDLGPRLRVKVDVWWKDRRCPASENIPSSSRCKVTLETYLTNWKNY